MTAQVRCSWPRHACAWKELRFSSYTSSSRNSADCAKNTRTRSVLFGVETHEVKEKMGKKEASVRINMFYKYFTDRMVGKRHFLKRVTLKKSTKCVCVCVFDIYDLIAKNITSTFHRRRLRDDCKHENKSPQGPLTAQAKKRQNQTKRWPINNLICSLFGFSLFKIHLSRSTF